MSEAWVLNASPLILFARIGRLDLIERLAPRILIPNAVVEEVRAGEHKDRTAAVALEWATTYRVDNIAIVTGIEHWDLGLGEAQVIAHCLGRSDGLSSTTALHAAVLPLTTCRPSERSASCCVRKRIGRLRAPGRW